MILALFLSFQSAAQVKFSIATDASILGNFSPRQKFWAFGQTVSVNFHFSKRESLYAWICYYSPGRFSNRYTATAISAATSPASFSYAVKSTWHFREVSLGWKHYFRSSFDDDVNWHLYGLAGFGLMFTRVENRFDPRVDTALYHFPSVPASGTREFKRLILDLGGGVEYPLGTDFYLYGELKTWIPTSSYPSKYLHENKNVPLPLMVNGGLRVLF